MCRIRSTAVLQTPREASPSGDGPSEGQFGPRNGPPVTATSQFPSPSQSPCPQVSSRGCEIQETIVATASVSTPWQNQDGRIREASPQRKQQMLSLSKSGQLKAVHLSRHKWPTLTPEDVKGSVFQFKTFWQ